MANREFSDLGRPDLFGEDGEFLGSEADYHAYRCVVCNHSVDGVSPQDAALEHDAWYGEDHEMKFEGE